MRAYALVEIGDAEAIDLFLREEDARAALGDALREESHWAGKLSVEPVELDVRDRVQAVIYAYESGAVAVKR